MRMDTFQQLPPINQVTVCITISAQEPGSMVYPMGIYTTLKSCSIKRELDLLPEMGSDGSLHSDCGLNSQSQRKLYEMVYSP